ncbi:MAG: PaaI family thioesterase [Promethearchaeota archaeon]
MKSTINKENFNNKEENSCCFLFKNDPDNNKIQKPNDENLNINEIPNLWPGTCFGCSPINKYGLKMQVCLSNDGCFSYITIPNHFCGFDGIVHGGIIATILDEIAAWAILVHLNKLGITQKANIRYYKPVSTNSPLLAEGQILSYQDGNLITKACIKSMKSILLAECESKWLIPELSLLSKLTGKDIGILKSMFEQVMIPIKRLRKNNMLNKVNSEEY